MTPKTPAVQPSQWQIPGQTSKLSRAAWYFVLLTPTLIAIGWTLYPTIHTISVMISFNLPEVLKATKLSDEDWLDPAKSLEIKRATQKGFRDKGLYIPLEDIMVASSKITSDGSGLHDPSLFMQKACGQGKLFAWIPFKLNLPTLGEKAFEWCWKLQN